MKKLLSLTLALAMAFSICIFPAQAANVDEDPVTIKASDVFYLSRESLSEVVSEITQYAQDNPTCTTRDLDAHNLELLKSYSNEIKAKKNGSRSSFLEPNEAEKAVCEKYGHLAAIYASVSYDANELALERYTQGSCWYDGNGDAFRHTYWSAFLVRQFYLSFSYSVNQATSIAREFTDAHEEDEEKGTIFSEMDLSNNETGFDLARDYLDVNGSYLREAVQDAVDNGDCVRVQERNGKYYLEPTDTTEKL